MKILRKNQVIIYTLALMLITAGYLNYTSNINNEEIPTAVMAENQIESSNIEESKDEARENVQTVEDQVADIGDATLVNSNDIITDYYAKTKLERDTMYSQMIESYEKILNSNNSLETQKQTVTQEVTKINNLKNSIMICENLIQTKGFDNCVVLVNDKSVSVIVGAESLKPEQIAQIQNIVSRELKVEIENIHISTK